MTSLVHAVWHCGPNDSTEHFVLTATDNGWLMRGIVMIPIDDEPGEIRYQITADKLWRTQEAVIDIGDETMEISVDGDVWRIDNVINDDLRGCVDIDLGWTPATNTLPIRRLELDVGESAETMAAWLRFPEMEFIPANQTYTRVSENLWRYRSGRTRSRNPRRRGALARGPRRSERGRSSCCWARRLSHGFERLQGDSVVARHARASVLRGGGGHVHAVRPRQQGSKIG